MTATLKDFIIPTPDFFDYQQCLRFLDRGYDDCLHQINKNSVLKAVCLQEKRWLIQLQPVSGHGIKVSILSGAASFSDKILLTDYVKDWWDLENDLSEFVTMATKDKVLSPLLAHFYGLRLLGINDLFEALSWAIIGQQINLTFAYKVKRQLVEYFDSQIHFENQSFWLFPTPHQLLGADEQALAKCQLSRNKIKYLKAVAEQLLAEDLNKHSLLKLTPAQIHEQLVSVKGIGSWTANYVMMKCLRIPTAFPVADVGLLNAIQKRMKLPGKPDHKLIMQLAKAWQGWEAYATLYLWQSLHLPDEI